MESSMPVAVALCAEPSSGSELRAALAEAGFNVALHRLQTESRNGAHLIVIDGAVETDAALQLCQRLHYQAHDAFVPIVFVTPADPSDPRRAALECGAAAVVSRPFQAADLVAPVEALLRIKERHDQLAVKASEAQRNNQRLQTAHHQIDQELELARRIQESLLPQTLPQVPRVHLAARYRPCGRVGGDFYDVFRLDEDHLGFYVADAMGHGVPASLLTVFVKTSVQTKDITGQQYRLVPPGEVLERLNRAMIKQALSDSPFITMAYVLLNCRTGALQFARAGHPYPLYVPREGPPTLWQIEGSLLGVFDARYRMQAHQLQSGDKVLLYTDGMDGASFGTRAVGQASLLAAADEYRRLPIDEMIDRLAADLFNQTRQSDDLSIVGLEMCSVE
jgi:phosphoserine phosphatase RsbU/P